MEWVETTGKSVAEAVDHALDQLGVDEADVEYEVVQEPKPGLFGRFGGNEARIRARVKPVSREKPGERRRRPKKGGGSGGNGGSREKRPEKRDESERSAKADRPSGGDRNRRDGADRPPKSESTKSRRVPAAKEAPVNESDVPVEDQARAAADFADGLVEAFGIPASVGFTIDEDEVIHLDITGEGLGLLVGPRGNTLSAIEELVRTVVQRRANGSGARIFVDVAGYRTKRREALAAFATGLGDKVLASGTAQVLDPMSAADRKVIHDTISGIDGLVTTSEGEDPRRYVVIRSA